MVEWVPAKYYMVVQFPNGTLSCSTEPGPALQAFGSMQFYQIRDKLWFSFDPAQGSKTDDSIGVQFNDGGRGKISGSLDWVMPKDCKMLQKLHKEYGSTIAIEHQLLRPLVEKAVYLAGPTMSSTESYAARRTELLNYIDDQIKLGVYKTVMEQVTDKDPLSGQMRTRNVTKIVLDPKTGLPQRQEHSPIQDFGIQTFNLAFNRIVYDKAVEDQIATQQKAYMEVQTAMANAQKAEQEAITVAKQGEAAAAKAKWEQEVIKAKMVTEAQQKLQVAELAAKEAEQYKKAEILKGEGEATRKKLVMEADGALNPKLDAIVKINEAYAQAFSKNRLVPEIQFGGNGQGTGTSAASTTNELVQMMTLITARQLGLDLKVSGQDKTTQQKK